MAKHNSIDRGENRRYFLQPIFPGVWETILVRTSKGKLVPNFSVDVYEERVPYKDTAQAERYIAALRNAGFK